MNIIQQIINLIRFFRKLYWGKILKSCGKNFVCCSGVKFHGAKYTSVGNNVRIGEKSYIHAKGGLTIGDNVKIYHGVTLGARSINELSDRKMKRHPTINCGVTIYSNSTILGGDTVIGEYSIIGAHKLIKESIPSNTTVIWKRYCIIGKLWYNRYVIRNYS